MIPRSRLPDLAARLTIVATVTLIFVATRRTGDIWWMDASRHGLNGAFVMDFAQALPFRNPIEYAENYYRQWPALTILFYPPLFSVSLAVGYSIFGVSEATALGVEALFLVALGLGAYRLSRAWLSTPGACAAALLLIGSPELMYWGRQIMLDVPAYAMLMWAAVYCRASLASRSTKDLLCAVVLTVLAVSTKYTAGFFLVVIFFSHVLHEGWRSLASRRALIAAAVGLTMMVPIGAIFLRFANFNLNLVNIVSNDTAARWSWAGLTYYLGIMPDIVGWPTMFGAIIFCIHAVLRSAMRLEGRDALLLSIWFFVGLIFYTMISAKEPRHILFITYPIVLCAVIWLDRMLSGTAAQQSLPLALAATVCVVSAVSRPPPYVTGLREAAVAIAGVAPEETNVAFWGKLDGTFVYAMRAYTGRPDLGVVRLDKLLLRDLVVSYSLGFTEVDWSEDAIVEKLRMLHVQYVAVQEGYMGELPVVQRLTSALRSARFVLDRSIPMASNYPFPDISRINIYRALDNVPRGRV
ncbi:MAG: glycosyltransferase family 39 protein, partial [Alphaproteobacteria bacterium]|nr:glycosyltransferase family 39 protein [Alphaproteobacteria bacterium]